MGAITENSVTLALADIFSIEDERLATNADKERRAAEAKRAAELRAKAEAEVKAQEAALLAQRQRIEGEMASRDKEASARIAALKAELKAVQWSREAIHNEIRAMGGFRVTEAKRSGSTWGVVAVVAIVACGFGLLLGWMNGRPDAPAPKPESPLSAAVALKATGVENVAERSASLPESNGVESITPPADTPTAAQPEKKKTSKRPKTIRKKPTRPTKPSPTTKPSRANEDDLSFFDNCGSDPMCGFSKRK